MKKLWRVLRGWLLLVALIGGGWAALHLFVLRPEPVPVTVHYVGRGVVERLVANTKAGSVRSRRNAELSPETAGRVVEIVHREGDAVKEGEPLLRLDDRAARTLQRLAKKELVAAQAKRDEAEAMLQEAEVALKDAVREYQRLEALHEKGAVSEAEFDRARTAKEAAEKALERARKGLTAAERQIEVQRERIRQAEDQLEYHELHAPFDGVVAKRYVELGEWAVPGKPVLRLLDPDDLYIFAELDEVDIGEVTVGKTVRVRLDPYRDRVFGGRITRVAPFVSETLQENRTIEIEVELSGGVNGTPLRPGISADVEVILESTPSDRLRVPTLALLEGDRVLVVKEGVAVSRRIETGLRNWDYTEVKAGLSEGDPVIVSLDREEVKDGARIVVEEEEKTVR